MNIDIDSKNITRHSEILMIVQFFFVVTSHNANVERVFSLMRSQWTKERNMLSVATIKGILTLQYNFKDMYYNFKDMYFKDSILVTVRGYISWVSNFTGRNFLCVALSIL